MQQVPLGKTGLQVGVAGLGSGGSSRLGQGYGLAATDSIAVVKAAFDLGVSFFDTAAVYKTESIVGEALKDHRDQVVLSTKAQIIKPGSPALGNELAPPAQIRASLEASLGNLQTDYVDVFHLHGVMPDQYDHCRNHLVPELIQMREQGKIRFFGITERFISDTNHTMLAKALNDDIWDVMMVGFNLINPSARKSVFPLTRQKGVATLIMFAVRAALSKQAALTDLLHELADQQLIEPELANAAAPLGFLTDAGAARSIMDAAYRFCRFEPGAEVILTGTGSIDHLRENIRSICDDALPDGVLRRLDDLFGHIDTVSGN
ncbi:MAG: aldo/keto reductase [Rhodospirillales bacterium]|nr:aldo/keto reductase [Rhodospirillales bacterium]